MDLPGKVTDECIQQSIVRNQESMLSCETTVVEYLLLLFHLDDGMNVRMCPTNELNPSGWDTQSLLLTVAHSLASEHNVLHLHAERDGWMEGWMETARIQLIMQQPRRL